MKNITLFIFGLSVLIFTGCEKVVDIDLNTDEPVLVVDGGLYNDREFNVALSLTSNYFDNSKSPIINNGSVSLLDETSDSTITLQSVGNGEYSTQNFTPTPKHSYRISITYNGKSYSGSDKMPATVKLDSITYRYEEASVFGDAGYVIFCEFEDPKAERNFYRVVYRLNGEVKNEAADFFLFDDQATDGNHIRIPLYSTRFKPGDHIDLQLISLNQLQYNYLNGIAQLASGEGQQSTSPANPENNLSNGALGYFGCFAVSSLSIDLPAK